MFYFSQLQSGMPGVVFVVLAVGACGGGGGGSGPAEPIPVSPAAENLNPIDTLPAPRAVDVSPDMTHVVVSHRGPGNLNITAYRGACSDGTVIQRELTDLADNLWSHQLSCALSANASERVLIEASTSADALFESELIFSTGLGLDTGIVPLDQIVSAREVVDTAFDTYVADELIADLELPSLVETAVAAALSPIISTWVNLTQPNSLYGVSSQQVRYASVDPRGNVSGALSGLIVTPDTSGAFTRRNRVVLLMHATGSTPSELVPDNAWLLLANIIAAQGYLVVAPDNWGRGQTAGQEETYLMANRTAANALDMLSLAVADPRFAAFVPTTAPAEITVVGYSQGGHSALAVAHLAATRDGNFQLREVYAGAGPYNLYETFRGVLQHVNGSCGDNPYCRYVDDETTLPFATNRVLPGFLAHTNTGLDLADLVSGNNLSAEFAADFLAADPAYDVFKAILEQSSFTKILNPAPAFDADVQYFLYHSEFDRLVPQANSAELASLLAPLQNVEYRTGTCNTTAYQTLFGLTDVVGLIHSLCGLSMLDEVVGELR